MNSVELTARSDATDPVVAVNRALHALVAQLSARGLPPAALTAMTWEAEHPAAFHPGRRVIDLSVREAIAGFLPPVKLRAGRPGLTIVARVAVPDATDPGPVWRGMTGGELARAYAARSQVPDLQAVFEQWARRTAGFVAAQHRPALDLVYGPGPNETLDLFYPTGVARPPLWIFVHGGFWQAMDKNLHGHFAAGMLRAGFAVAVPNYELAPTVTLATIVDQTRRCVRFLHAHADGFGLDPNSLHVAGHSAGGHLAAMLASDPDTAFLRSSLPIAGLFDLEPMHLLPMGRLLGLDDAERVRELSPMLRRPTPGCTVSVAVGAGELPEFVRQSDALAAAWGCGPAHHVAGRHHFDVVDELADGGPLLEQALRAAGR
jgi:arylformamidase